MRAAAAKKSCIFVYYISVPGGTYIYISHFKPFGKDRHHTDV
jgi:hypothetical protein